MYEEESNPRVAIEPMVHMTSKQRDEEIAAARKEGYDKGFAACARGFRRLNLSANAMKKADENRRPT